jgi:Protein of unknown function (DUF416)
MYPGLELHRATIDGLPKSLKVALAGACAQRQAAVYSAYAKRTGRGNAKAFDFLLNAIWDDIRRPQAPEQEHTKWLARGYRLLRQKAQDDIYTAGAEFAVLSLLYSNQLLIAGKTQDVIYSANQPFNSIDNFLTSPIGKKPQFDEIQADTNAQVFAHPLFQAEHHRQERDLFDVEQIVSQPELIPDAVDRIRRRAEFEAEDFIPIIELPGV